MNVKKMEKSPTIILLHIGAPKCGSSAIQKFLANNATELYGQNIIVPGRKFEYRNNISGNHIWYIEELATDIKAAKEVIARQLKSLVAEHLNNVEIGKQQPKIIISAENLTSKQNYLLFEGIPEFSVHPLIYVRRQDDFLISAWQQWYLKENDDFLAWLISSIGRLGNWSHLLEPWAKTYGKENMLVRAFDKNRMHKGSIISDFCRQAGIAETSVQTDVGNANPSFSKAVGELAACANGVFKDVHDQDFFHMITALTGDRHYKSEKDEFLSSAQRRAIMSHYEAGNSKLREQFFPELGEKDDLFSPVVDVSGSDVRDIESAKFALLAELVFGLYKRLKNLETGKTL